MARGATNQASLKTVADHLKDEAERRPSAIEADLFGRSAINRYYYCIYSEVISTLNSFGLSRQIAHKNIPDLLEGQLVDSLIAELRRVRLNSDKGAVYEELVSRTKTHARSLSRLIREAYNVRCTADYQPEVLLTPLNGTLQLGSVTLDQASLWFGRASKELSGLRRCYRDAGLV